MSDIKTTDQTYAILSGNLYYPILLYIPDVFLELFSKYKEFDWLLKLKDLLLCVEDENYNFFGNQESDLSFMIKKQKKLESNIHHLVDYKATHTGEQFIYLLNKYKENLDAYTFASELLVEDVNKSSSKLLKTHKSFFTLQEFYFKQHQSNLEKLFPDCVKSKYNKFLGPALLKDFIKNHQKSALEKRLKITDEEVDAYLLRTVFNVKF